MSTYGGSVPWWRVVHADGTPPRPRQRGREHHLAEGTPCRPPGGSTCRRATVVAADPRRVRTCRRPLMESPVTTYRLAYPTASRAVAPALDEFQQSVVDHPGGPLLVLAGPGTGKTTTLVEAIVDRIEHRGASPGLGAGADLQPQGRRAAARPGHRPARPHDGHHAELDLPLLRLRPGAPVLRRPSCTPRRCGCSRRPSRTSILQDCSTDEAGVGPLARRAVGGASAPAASRARCRRCSPGPGRRGSATEGLRRLGESEEPPRAGRRGSCHGAVPRRASTTDSLIDYPELIYRAVGCWPSSPRSAPTCARATPTSSSTSTRTPTPARCALLQAIAGDGRDLVVVGDPDQSIYAFRGAEVRGILDFPDQFRTTATAAPADVVALQVTRRFGPRLLARLARRRLRDRHAVARSTARDVRRRSASPTPADRVRRRPGRGAAPSTPRGPRPSTSPTCCAGRTSRTASPGREMAVLVRSGRTTIPPLRRSLGAAGVPVEVASDDTPLVQEPAVLPLLDALRAVVDLDDDDPDSADYLGADRGRGAAGLAARRARRHRACGRWPGRSGLARSAAGGRARQPRVAAPVARAAPRGAARPGRPRRASRGRARRPRHARSATLLARAASQLDAGATAEEVLWKLWSGTDWPRRLRRTVDAGRPGRPARRTATSTPCARCSRWPPAPRSSAATPACANFLESLPAQQIPADTLADRGVRGEAVRLLTAHRSKGLEWRLVVVAHVQEEAWPDLRRRSTLLQADRIGADGLLPPVTTRDAARRGAPAVLRRLHPRPRAAAGHRGRVARRRRRAAVPVRRRARASAPTSGVDGPPASARCRWPAWSPSCAARVADPDRRPAALRGRRSRGSARLAGRRTAGHAARPAGRPGRVVGHPRPQSVRARRSRPPTSRSPSRPARWTRCSTCPAQWFLEREAGGDDRVPAVAGLRPGRARARRPDRQGRALPVTPSAAELMAHVDTVWGQIAFRTPWSAAQERAEVERGARPVPGLARAPRRPHRARHRAAAHRRGDPARRAAGAAQRLRRPARARRRRPGRGRRPQDHEVPTDRQGPADQPPARPLPARRRPRRRRRAASAGAGRARRRRAGAAAQERARSAPRSRRRRRRSPAPTAAPPVERAADARPSQAVRGEDVRGRAPATHCEHCDFHAICPTKGAGTVLS